MLDAVEVFVLRTVRAWRYYRLLDYSWRLAWAKAGMACGLER
jgi:hypothetical protein